MAARRRTMRPNGNNRLAGVDWVLLGVGVGGLILWLGIRGSAWLTGELAYPRGRRPRLHTITLGAPETSDEGRRSAWRLAELLCATVSGTTTHFFR